MVSFLTNPRSFMAFSRVAAPVLGVATACAFALGLYRTFTVPEDALHGDTVRMMFIHVRMATGLLMARKLSKMPQLNALEQPMT